MKYPRNLSVPDYHDLVKRMLRAFEGEFLRPYVDPVGIITIGIGINIEQVSTNLEAVVTALGFNLSNPSEVTYKNQIQTALNNYSGITVTPHSIGIQPRLTTFHFSGIPARCNFLNSGQKKHGDGPFLGGFPLGRE